MAHPLLVPLWRASYAAVEDPQTNAQVDVSPAEPAADDGVEKVAVMDFRTSLEDVGIVIQRLAPVATRTNGALRF